MNDFETPNMSSKELFDSLEVMILTNPESEGVQILDTEGRTWYICLEDNRFQHSKGIH